MTILSARAFQLKRLLLENGAAAAPQCGFTTAALARALDTLPSDQQELITTQTLSQMFERGYPASLVEFVVRDTNRSVQRHLEETYAKSRMIALVEKNADNFIHNRFFTPSAQDVVVAAIQKKLELMAPFAPVWPAAVQLEYCPSNFPYTIITLAEFSDTTSYYMERVSALNAVLEPARQILQSKAMASRIPSSTDSSQQGKPPITQVLEGFLQGIPLSSGPHVGDSSFSFTWFQNRAKMAALYGTTMTSLIGDTSPQHSETMRLAEQMARTMF